VRLDRQKMYDLLPKKMLPQECAKVILSGVQQNKATILVTFLAKSQWYLQRLSPVFVAFIYRRILRKIRNVLYTD
jgi:hypothetical protein